MDLVHDVLDKQVRDKHQRSMGRVDGIVLAVSPGRPPRVSAIEVGLQTLAARIHPRLGRWVAAFERRWGPPGAGPFQLPFDKVRDIGLDIEFDVVAEQTGAQRWENYLRRRVVERLPGSAR